MIDNIVVACVAGIVAFILLASVATWVAAPRWESSRERFPSWDDSRGIPGGSTWEKIPSRECVVILRGGHQPEQSCISHGTQ